MATKTQRPPTAKPITGMIDTGEARRPAMISKDDIRIRAYQLFQARVSHGLPGDAMSDWLQAERELAGQARGARSPLTLRT